MDPLILDLWFNNVKTTLYYSAAVIKKTNKLQFTCDAFITWNPNKYFTSMLTSKFVATLTNSGFIPSKPGYLEWGYLEWDVQWELVILHQTARLEQRRLIRWWNMPMYKETAYILHRISAYCQKHLVKLDINNESLSELLSWINSW